MKKNLFSSFIIMIVILMSISLEIGLQSSNKAENPLLYVLEDSNSSSTRFESKDFLNLEEMDFGSPIEILAKTKNNQFKPTQSSYKIGDERSFNSRNYFSEDSNNLDKYFYQVQATIVAISEYSIIFVQNSKKNNFIDEEMRGQSIALTFDEVYAQEVPFLGTPTDVDQNGKIILLFLDIIGLNINGYYSPLHLLEPSGNSRNFQFYSNFADMLFINLNPDDKSVDIATVAHEFQHLIQYNNDPNEYFWLNEGLSTYSELFTGFNNSLEHLIDNKLVYGKNPALTSLTYWQELEFANYDAAYLFLLYLSDRFNPSIIKSISQDGLRQGLTSINHAIRQYNSFLTLEEVFQDFSIALAINNPLQPKYSFKSYSKTANKPSNLRLDEDLGALLGQQVSHWSLDLINLTISSSGDYWLSFNHETAPFEDRNRKFYLYLLQQDMGLIDWKVSNLTETYSNRITLNSTSAIYLVIISTTGTSSGRAVTNPGINWKTGYNLHLQKAFTSLPLIIPQVNNTHNSLSFKITLPQMDNGEEWIDPEFTEPDINIEIFNATDGNKIPLSLIVELEETEKFYYFELNPEKLPKGDYFLVAKLSKGEENIYLFSSGWYTLPDSSTSFNGNFFSNFIPLLTLLTIIGFFFLILWFTSRRLTKNILIPYEQYSQSQLRPENYAPHYYERPQQQQSLKRYCTECGKPIALGYNFCMECGHKVQ